MRVFAMIAIVTLRLGSLTANAGPAPCELADTRAARMVGIDPQLEMTLDDGSRLRLFGVEPPSSPEGARVAAKLTDWLGDRDINVAYISSTVDRWGRRAANVSTASPEPGAAPISVATALIDAGLARARVEPGAAGCVTPFFDIEAVARSQKLGLWADAANNPIPADQRREFAARAGKTVIVEGRVTGVGDTATRVYLNYGPIRTVDFSVTIAKSTLKPLANAGFDPKSLVGANTRVRGTLDMRFGPQIEIIHPAAIEVIK